MIRRLSVLLPAAAALAIAGCGGSSVSEDELAAEAAKLAKPLPGIYSSTTRLVAYEVPGAAPQDAERMTREMAALAPETRSFCLSQRDADKGFEDMWRQMQEGDCRFEKFDTEGGKLDARMVCSTPQGVTSTVAMTGTAGPESSLMVLDVRQQTEAVPGGEVLMKLEIANRREGDCPEGSAESPAEG